MKKNIILICLLILVLSGCSNSNKLQTEANKTIQKIVNKFNYETGKCLATGVNIEYSSLNRGDEVTIVGEDEKFYFIDVNNLILGVKKDYIRTSKEEEFEEYEGYTRSGAGLYSDIDLDDKIKTFSLNDNVKVIDKFKDILIIDNDESIAYMDENSVSDSKIRIYRPPVVTPDSVPSYDGSSSGGGSSSSGGGEEAPPQSTSGDGEDIQLAYHPGKNSVLLLTANDVYCGKVLIDNTITFITSLNRNDTVYILDEEEGIYSILIEGRIGKVDKKYIRKDSEVDYEAWTAYTRNGTHLYDDCNLDNSIMSFSVNDTVKVIEEIDSIYVVELENGQIGYMNKSNLSEDKIKIYIAPRVEEPIVPSGGDSSSGGGSSSSGGGDIPASTPEWTEPVL